LNPDFPRPELNCGLKLEGEGVAFQATWPPKPVFEVFSAICQRISSLLCYCFSSSQKTN
jgi:hypothetical protein